MRSFKVLLLVAAVALFLSFACSPVSAIRVAGRTRAGYGGNYQDFESFAIRSSRSGRARKGRSMAECPAPLAACGPSLCADLSADTANCGKCLNVCALNAVCCNGTCADTTTDLLNCGGCGAVCKGSCVSGVCNYVSRTVPKP